MVTSNRVVNEKISLNLQGAVNLANALLSKSEFETQAVVQLQAHLATQERRIKCGQRFALTHNLFPLAPVVTPQC